MKKLKLEDICILTPQQQVKTAILDKYASIDSFADAINLYPRSVMTYLRSKSLGSDKFKIKLVTALERSYNDIVISPAEQLHEMVENIYRNVKKYDENSDLVTMLRLKQLCIEYNLDIETMKMNRSIALHYFFKNQLGRSIEFLEMALSKARELRDYSYRIKYLSDLALMYYYDRQFKISESIFEEAELLSYRHKALDNEALFNLNHLFGILLNEIGRHEEAKEKFSKAIEVAHDDVSKGRAIMNLGLSHKKQGSYQIAIQYYVNALEYMKDDFERQSIVYNNLAEVYKVMGDYDNALKHVETALDLVNQKDQNYYFITFQTYAQIMALKGETKDVIQRLLDRIIESDNEFTDKSFLIKGIETAIQLAYKDKNDSALRKLELFLFESIEKAGANNTEYVSELERCLGKILRCYNGRFDI